MAVSIDAIVGQRAIDTARERGELDIPGVTSLEGTSVDPLGHLQDATILGLSGVPYNETLLAQLARTDPELVRDLMRARTYMSGEGLLGQGASGQRQISIMDAVGGGDSTIHLGQKMGESYDDFLERIISSPEEFLSKDETTAEDELKKAIALEPEITISDTLVKDAQEKLEKIYDRKFTLEAIRERIQKSLVVPETPLGTTDIFNAETGQWESVYEKMVDRPPKNVYERLAPVRDRPEAIPLGTPAGTTDIFDIETGKWTALTKTEDEKTEEEKINSLIAQLSRPKVKEGQAWRKSAEDELKKSIALEEETATVLSEEEDANIFQRILAETLGLPVDVINTAISSILRAVGAPQHIIDEPVGGRAWLMANKGMTIDDVVNAVGDMLTATTSSDVVVPATVDTQWPAIPSVDEEYFPGAGMTAKESIERTRVLNTANMLNPPHDPRTRPIDIDPITTQSTYEQTDNFLEGLSQAMRNLLNSDPELMDQYLAARNNIMAQLDKTGYKEHEDWYPGSRAAANAAGFNFLGATRFNPAYNEYKDAQRALMGLEEGQKFWSDDWINNLGWMTPEQINRVSGYGN